MNVSKLPVISLLFFFLFFQPSLNAESPTDSMAVVNDDSHIIPISKYLELLEDEEGKLTINDVVSPAIFPTFQRVDKDVLNLGYKKSVYWLRFTLKNEAENTNEWILEYDIKRVGKNVTLFVPGNDGFIINKDDATNPHNQPGYRNTLFRLKIKKGEQPTYYTRIESETYLPLKLMLWQEKVLNKRIKTEYIFFSIVFGIFLILSIYNLSLLFSFRDISYLYFVFFIIFYELFQLVDYGSIFEFFPASQPFGAVFYPFSVVLAAIALVFFGRNFLLTKKFMPRSDKYLIVLIALMAADIFLYQVFKFAPLLLLRDLLLMLTSTSIFIMAIIIQIKGYPPARYFTLAMSSFIILSVISVLPSFDMIPVSFITIYGRDIGGVLMVALFSFGLAYRINTTREEKEEAQKRAIENLHKADKLKDEFLANTSHELRTPLTGIIGIAESMIDGAVGALSETALVNLRLIVLSGKRLSNLINDILDYSRLKEKDLHLSLKPVDLKSMAEIVIQLSKPLIAKKPIRLKNKIKEDIPAVLGDEDRLQQILYNLLGNAIKFTEEGEVTISAGLKLKRVTVTVSDTGIGIPRDKFETIFNSFEQLDASASREYGGSGIGLSITRQLVELHGGTISVESEIGKGSQFTFSLPVSHEKPEFADTAAIGLIPLQSDLEMAAFPEPPVPEEEITEYETDETVRILIVDDEPVNLTVLTNQLALHNYKLIKASSGSEALNIVDENKPDLILLDLMMPKMTGLDVTRKLREKYSIDKLPIIIVTAKNRVSDLVTSLEAGANDYIAKPFSKNELISRIQLHDKLLRMNKELYEHRLHLEDLVEKRTHELGEKNRQILDSINYAGLIQTSILPPEGKLTDNLGDYFVLWKPKDIVGGDFYWFFKIGDKYLIAVVDCTGHGVPGALMTMMAHSQLTHIVEYKGMDNPAKILKELNITMRNILNRSSKHTLSDDGLDIGICYCMPKERKIMFAGAKIGIYIYQNKEICEIRGDRQSIGYKRSKIDFEYKNHEIRLGGNEIFYITSDGYIDQLGGTKSRSFGRQEFQNTLIQICNEPFPEQKRILEKTLDEYRGNDFSQIDDITVFAFRM